MSKTSVRFDIGGWEWMAERSGVGFVGQTDLGPVDFLITIEALVELLDPELDGMDPETAVETFVEFEADIHRIAQREFVRRLGGEPPVLITADDVAG